MNRVYQYSIIRYLPFSETGEFANIGVIALDLESDRVAFELAPKRFQRVRNFFDTSAHEAYGAAIDMLRVELGRVAHYLPAAGGWSGKSLFSEVTRPRESSIVFSEPRAIQSGEALPRIVERLFARYIKREFAAPESAESVLTKDIRKALTRNGIKHFKHVRLEDDVVPVTFPLAYRDRTLRAIKPLAFSQRNPLSVFDYGAHWRKRLSYLLERGKIERGNLLLAVEGPGGEADEPMREAYNLALNELTALPFEVVPAEHDGIVDHRVVEFARAVAPPQRHFLH